MHIDCDCHFFPKDAFDYVDERFADRKPRLVFTEDGGLAGIEFPGRPPQMPGTNPLPRREGVPVAPACATSTPVSRSTTAWGWSASSWCRK